MLYIKSKFEFNSMSSFKAIIAGTMLAATASLGVITPDAKATPSPGEDWDYVIHVEPCVPKVSVHDNVVDNTIRLGINVPILDNDCKISREIYLYIQDDRPQPLRLKAVYHRNSWVASIGDIRPGRYRVMGISPTPSGIGDYAYIPAGELGIDQVITIGNAQLAQASWQSNPVAPPPSVAPPQRVVTTLDSESQRLLRNFDQWMSWFQVNIWPQIQPLIRAIEGINS